LGRPSRGWCNYFGRGASSQTINCLDNYDFRRIYRWLSKRHAGLNKHNLVRRHLPG